MICYKDMTFCTFYKKCTEGDKCFRSLTPDVRKNAAKWWGNSEVPIAVFADKPECFKKKE